MRVLRKVGDEVVGVDLLPSPYTAVVGSIADRATVRDDHALLHRALSRLDRDDREVLLLSRFQELSFAEIATILECSAGAAKVRAHRALRQLEEIVKASEGVPES